MAHGNGAGGRRFRSSQRTPVDVVEPFRPGGGQIRPVSDVLPLLDHDGGNPIIEEKLRAVALASDFHQRVFSRQVVGRRDKRDRPGESIVLTGGDISRAAAVDGVVRPKDSRQLLVGCRLSSSRAVGHRSEAPRAARHDRA